MLETIHQWIEAYNEYVGGYLVLALLLPTGIYLSIRTGFLQIRYFRHAWRIVFGKYDDKKDKGDVSHFKALTTALASTVGTGNIVGVSLAIYWGGPGALFWMWITGFFGMMLKLTECTLALKYRITNSDGTVSGGPMYYMEKALKPKIGKVALVLAFIFAAATVLCSLGTGNMAQANSITDALTQNKIFNIDHLLLPVLQNIGISSQSELYQNPSKYFYAFLVALMVFIIVVGGLRRIAEVTARLVPFMAFFYILSALIVLVVYVEHIPSAFALIFRSAFEGTAVAGGFAGSAFLMAMIMGIRRGLFSNEAGQGSAAIAHAAARTEHPLREGFVASLEPFIDTLVICTCTGLVLVVTGAWQTQIQGVGMTLYAFESAFSEIGLPGISQHLITIGLFLFAFSTIIGWSYYGSRGIQYFLGEKAIKPYYYIFSIFVFLGAIWKIDFVWSFVDMVITFMTIPNLIALIFLYPEFRNEIKTYLELKKLHNWK